LVIVVLVIASVGLWYYFTIYVPRYEAERLQLLTLYTTADPVDLDPALAIDYDSWRIMTNVYDRLVAFKRGTSEIESRLATSWEIPDSTTFIFNLRDDVEFHDGTPFNAESVKYSFDRAIELDEAPSYLFWVINKTEVIDTHEVKITLNYEFSPFLSVMAHPAASIVSKTAVEELGEGFNSNPIGTGPFIFDSWSLGKELILTSNKEYFRGAPQLERIVFKTILEGSARKTALEQGEVDVVVGGGILPADMPDLEANPDIRIYEGVGLGVEYLGFNTLNPPLNDSRVREAIAYAINYNAIIDDAMEGAAERLAGPIPPSIFGYKELPPYQRDVAKAMQILEEAGYSGGFDITLTYNIESLERRKVAEEIRNSLAEVGINVQIKGLDWDSAIDEYLEMGHEILLNSWWPDYYDPDSYLFPQFHSYSLAPYGANIFGLNDTEIDTLIDDGLMATDSDERLAIYQEAQERIVEQLPCIFLYVPSEYDFVRYNVQNWVYVPSEHLEFYEVYKQ
jgi:peptide/nickel transport system substrate-binding protein